MAWRYRGPRGWVSKGTYERYKYLDTYRRLSDAKWRAGGNFPPKGEHKGTVKGSDQAQHTSAAPTKDSTPAPSSIKTLKDWQKYYDQYEYDEPIEVETSVDY